MDNLGFWFFFRPEKYFKHQQKNFIFSKHQWLNFHFMAITFRNAFSFTWKTYIIFPLFVQLTSSPTIFSASKLRYTFSNKKIFHKQFFPAFFFLNSFMHIHSVFIICRWFTHSHCRSRAGTEKTQNFIFVVSGVKINRQVGFGVAKIFRYFSGHEKIKKFVVFSDFFPYTADIMDTRRYLAGDVHSLEKVNKIVPRKMELPMLMQSSWVAFFISKMYRISNFIVVLFFRNSNQKKSLWN